MLDQTTLAMATF